ncbi:NACHT domain-containing protein, partial [Streptomyces sp. NPDC050997]|uniref:NACHT domain-containing protein n=1 Tax=Streptomyces sp. NPDC050997 TaxID=3155519 RepID=UPI003446F690
MTKRSDNSSAEAARETFARRLRDLRDASGAKNADVVAASARLARKAGGGRELTANAVTRLLSGRSAKAPDWEVLLAYVQACQLHARTAQAPAVDHLYVPGTWKTEHTSLVRALERSEPASSDGKGTSSRQIEAALAAYAQRVRESWGHLDLEVLLPLDDQGRHPAIRLREVFIEPGVRSDPPPVELPRELVRRLEESGELPNPDHLPSGVVESLKQLQDAYAQRPVRGILQVLDEEDARKTVVLGDPGAGKSTLAKYLALSLAVRRPWSVPLNALESRVGIVVELRQYAEAQWVKGTFENFLEHRHAQTGLSVPSAVLQHLLRSNRALIIFDGLDEIFDPKVRQAASEQIAAFAARWPLARIVVTSRVIGYKRHVLDGASFAHYMLQDLDHEQIATFTKRWYSLSCPTDTEQAIRLAERLQSAVRDSRPVRELAGNPLLLTILAIVGRRQPLPKDRLGVYRQAVTVLTAQWDQQAKHLQADLPPAIKDVLDALDRGEVLMMLARAMQAGTAGLAGNHIYGEDLEHLLRSHLEDYGLPPGPASNGARALLSQLRERNFILARYGGEVYGFVHRAFLEHLAAADIYNRYTRAREWSPQELLDDVIAPHASDPAWHEVLLLLIGQLEPIDAAGAIDCFISSHQERRNRHDASLLVLALRALAEVPKIGLLNSQSVCVIRATMGFLNSSVHDSLAAAYPAFASFSPYWVGREPFLAWFRTRGQFSPSVDTPQLVCRLHPDRAELSRFACSSYSSYDRGVFASALVEQWPADDEIRALLLHLARDDEEEHARLKFFEALVEGWPEDDDVFALLFDVARNSDSGGYLRRGALQILAKRRPEDDDVTTLLLDAVRGDGQVLARVDALKALAEQQPENNEIRALWINLFRGLDTDPFSGRTALQALVEQWPEHVEVRSLLFDVARNGTAFLRSAALRMLVERWPEDGEVRPLLFDLARGDEDGDARLDALKVLVERWPEDGEVRPLLFDLARGDEDGDARLGALKVRLDALKVLVERWPEDGEVRPLLFDLARGDV